MSIEEKSKLRMNLAAIKKVDPYAKDIVDTSSHVAFYTFNSDQNEWEKTDVEGAFFVYSRNAQPFHSIFINNRLNTTSFVEPITNHLELQSQPPFLLYRNERSRIRGFWFYNSQECDRIGSLIGQLVQQIGPVRSPVAIDIMSSEKKASSDVNIFKMLSKAQQEYNNSQQQSVAPGNVLQFFATAESSLFQRAIPNTLSVEQLEKQQRAKTPRAESFKQKQLPFSTGKINNDPSTPRSSFVQSSSSEITNVNDIFNAAKLSLNKSPNMPGTDNDKEKSLRQLFIKDPPQPPTKPALMPPTMFDKPSEVSRQDPLNQMQLVQAFSYLMENDEDFVQKLHNAYLKALMDTYQ